MLTIQVCSLAASWRPLSCSPIFLSVTQFLNVYIDMHKIVQCSYCNTCEYFTVSHLNTHPYPCQSKSIPRCASVYINVSCTIYSSILYSCIPYWPMINIKAKQRCVMVCPHCREHTCVTQISSQEEH